MYDRLIHIVNNYNLKYNLLQPPRRSYERKARTYWESQTEADSASEDEIYNTERNKSSKKRKIKEVSADINKGACYYFYVM